MHPYFTERMLQQSDDARARSRRIAVQHRERLDGSGYPRGLAGQRDLAPGADPRRGRRLPGDARAAAAPPARSPDDAARGAARRGAGGRLDADAVEAVLAAAGHRVVRRREGPAGLTAREVEVLRLVARGLSNKEIAARLVISPKTAGNHIEHIYTKIGATNRAAASLFAMQHGLLPEEGFAPGPDEDEVIPS